MKRSVIAIIAVMFTGLIALLAQSLIMQQKTEREMPAKSRTVGKMLPEFALPQLEGDGDLTAKDIAGEYIIVNIFASWCSVCRYEHETLNEIATAGIPIVGVNWRDDRQRARDLLSNLGNPYRQVIFDKHGELVIALGVTGAPESFLIDPEGRIIHHHVGPLDGTVFARDILPLISR